MNLLWAFATVVLIAGVEADPSGTDKKSVLDGDPDVFALVTPDRLLGKMTRRRWLELYQVNGKEYWAAWDCKDKPCDTKARAHIRSGAKLIPRTSRDPKPIDEVVPSGASRGG